jgi:hypothetical protein
MNTKLRIEPKTVVPGPRAGRTVFPLESLAPCKENKDGEMVGPCIYAGEYSEELRDRVNGQIQYYKRKHPESNFTVRKCQDGIFRIWRTA